LFLEHQRRLSGTRDAPSRLPARAGSAAQRSRTTVIASSSRATTAEERKLGVQGTTRAGRVRRRLPRGAALSPHDQHRPRPRPSPSAASASRPIGCLATWW